MLNYDLKRFHQAQEPVYLKALQEIRNGKKETHWMWYMFPQLAGLGYSETAKFYAIADLEEATCFLKDHVLAQRLEALCQALLEVEGKSAQEIFGTPDDLKLRSSMTLFNAVTNSSPLFQQVLDHYFDGKKDEKTLRLLGFA
ncbi:DUF1810 domain-containing protein [Pedobacter sp. SYSU D00535]|uniref:DUF1810 domain-containing protein n=1 Tax=Pedobacter sp. SYSU D00535 TaxID=2810308 RepID=UPI001A976CF1|nr:DUF1810 domain-containing protein [Pedobacter sp. SYSU D00535]